MLGITLVSPQLMNAHGIGQQTPGVGLSGLLVIQKVGYQAQVIPAPLAGVFLPGWRPASSASSRPISTWVIVPFISPAAGGDRGTRPDRSVRPLDR